MNLKISSSLLGLGNAQNREEVSALFKSCECFIRRLNSRGYTKIS